jgi:tetratricopeptide (TPR) repeat protein
MINLEPSNITKIVDLLRHRLDISEVKTLWFMLFSKPLDDEIPNCSLDQGIIQLVISAQRRNKLLELHQTIIDKRPDLHLEIDGLNEQITTNSQITSNNQGKFFIPCSRNPFFTGRETALTIIDQALTANKRTAIQVLSGLGGIGKTAIAVEYAYRYHDQNPDDYIFWVMGQSFSSINNGYLLIANRLGLVNSFGEPREIIVNKVCSWFTNHQNWLLILDGIDDLEIFQQLTKILPTEPAGKVLMTTRLANTGRYCNIIIEKFLESEGVEFLLKRATISLAIAQRSNSNSPHSSSASETNDQQFAAKLVKELDGLPLALEQARAYIVENNHTVEKCWYLYQSNKFRLLDKSSQYGSDHVPVTITFRLAFEKLTLANLVAGDLLRMLSFLAPEIISEEIFILGQRYLPDSLQTAIADELIWDEICQVATQHSLIKRDGNTFSIHHLVQLVIRELMSVDEQRQWLTTIVQLFAEISAAMDPDNIENWPLCARLWPHQQILFEQIKDHALTIEASATMLSQAGYYAVLQGRYQEAEPLYQQALQVQEYLWGKNHVNYVEVLHNLANLYYFQGRYELAEPLYQYTAQLRRQGLGIDHPDYATSLSDLAVLYYEQGHYEAAEPPLKQALEIRQQVLGATHPSYAQTLHNLAYLYSLQGQYDEARPLYKQSLEIYGQIRGGNHPDYAQSLNNLGWLYSLQGRHEEAEPLFKEALQIRQQVLGTEHPHYAQSLQNLANLYHVQRRYLEALPLYQEALAIYEVAVGQTHPDYIRTANNLVTLQQIQPDNGTSPSLINKLWRLLRK